MNADDDMAGLLEASIEDARACSACGGPASQGKGATLNRKRFCIACAVDKLRGRRLARGGQ